MTSDTTADTGPLGPAGAVGHAPPVPLPDPEPTGDWRRVVTASPSDSPRPSPDAPLPLRRLVLQVVAAAVVVVALVGIAGTIVSRRIAESESVHQAVQLTDVLAESVVQPSLTDASATDPRAAGAALDALVRARVLSDQVVRVKVWNPQGTVVYSDEARLVGQTFGLDDGARRALQEPQTRAEISNLGLAENRYERSFGKLLEVYRPIWTPAGRPLLFETYQRYDTVSRRSSDLWRGFAGITLSSLVAVFVLLVPLVWTLVARVRRAQAEREALMQRALLASEDERRRIAADLHDGVVQQLVAASFAVAAGSAEAHGRGDRALARRLDDAAGTVRTGIGGLRSLLVDIYPPNLHSAGLAPALRDLASTYTGRGPALGAVVDEATASRLNGDQQAAVFRFVQEAIRNAVRHAQAELVQVRLETTPTGTVRVEVTDDGTGLPAAALGAATEGHFGLSIMHDVATGLGGSLDLLTGADRATHRGTTWRLEFNPQ